MDAAADPGQPGWVAALRRFARERPAMERCELCAAGLGPEHPHLVEPAKQRLLCVCDACALLFSNNEADTRYRRVPRRVRRLADLSLTDAQWDGLLVPINLAFFYHSSPAGRVVAYYPSPAGATESALGLEAWRDLAAANPVLAGLEPDVEALLVNRLGGGQRCYVVPIDQCYRLVGLIRARWRGLAGGPEVWKAVAAFFDRLDGVSPTPGGMGVHA